MKAEDIYAKLDEIREMEKWEGAELNKAKKRLAYEVTKMVHGEEIANQVQAAADAVFAGGGVSADMPTTEVDTLEGKGILDLLVETKLLPSKGEARRLVQQGGVSVNDEKVTDPTMMMNNGMVGEDGLIIKKGKKVFHRVILK